MSFTLIRSVAGFALLAALAAGCGTAAAAPHHHHSRPTHAAVTTPPAPPTRAAVTTPPAPPATAPVQTANPVPQGNGGDQDADNNDGPSDGDGNI